MESIVLYSIFGAFAFGGLSAIVASTKKKDAVGWFIIGFLFGPFGFIASLIVDEAEPDSGQSPARTKDGTFDFAGSSTAPQATSDTGSTQTEAPHKNYFGRGVEQSQAADPRDKQDNIQGVSVSDYLLLAKRKAIISEVEKDHSFIQKMRDADWEFTRSNGIDEIAPYVTEMAQKELDKSPEARKWKVVHRAEEYFGSIDREVARNEAYRMLAEGEGYMGTFALELIEDRNLLDIEESERLLQDKNIEVRKRALKSFEMHPSRYQEEDLNRLEKVKAQIPDAFPVIAKEVEVDGLFKKKPDIMWECECGTKNEQRREYCSRCRRNERGFKKDELQPKEAVEMLENRIGVLEELLEAS
jgi:hypothetical protein